MNSIDWKPKALKQLEKIKQSPVRQKIYTETQTLADFPNCQNVKNWLIMPIVTVCEWVIIGCFSSLMEVFTLLTDVTHKNIFVHERHEKHEKETELWHSC